MACGLTAREKRSFIMPTGTINDPALAQQLLEVLDTLSGGVHAGFRPAHAKGLMCEGTFTPTHEARELTRARHASAASTPVSCASPTRAACRTSPTTIPRTPARAGWPSVFSSHEHTDVICHSVDGFAVGTGEEFLTLLRAAAEAGAGRPEAIRAFLASHPNAKRFAETPKPVPTSFAREAYFSPTAFKFTNAKGVDKFGRFRFRPELGTQYLGAEDAAKKPGNFLFDEIDSRLSGGPIRFGVFVQIADPAQDKVTDASSAWPSTRPEIPFGTITLTRRVDHEVPERRKVIFDPHPRVDGIDESGDPLTPVRADIYLLSGRRRREALGDVRH
jgi:catalase